MHRFKKSVMSVKGMTRRGVVAGEGHGAGAVFGKASSSAPLRNRGTHIRSVAVAPSATVKMTLGVVVVRIFIWPAIVAVLALGVVIHLNDMTGCEGIIGFEVMNSLCP